MTDTPRFPAFPAPLSTCELLLVRNGADLQATWRTERGFASPFTLASPLSAADVAEHRWYLEDYLVFPGPGDHVRARAFEQRLDAFGKHLRDALRPKTAADPLQALMAKPEPRRIELTITSDDADALALPWELLRDDPGPLVFRDLVLRRQVPRGDDVPPSIAPVAALPLRVLLVVSRPTDVSFIDPRSSAGPLLDALDPLGGLVRVELCDPPTLDGLRQRLDAAKDRGEPFHIVHFDGHGKYLPNLGVGALCFEDDHANNHFVRGPDLGDLLSRMRVPVAVLEACQTADMGTAPVFGSVAPALLKSGVGSVIAFSHAVFVTAATILVESFYEALCKGKSVGHALNEGRRALHAKPIRWKTRKEDLTLRDWHIAELYQAGEDPVLVPGGAPASVAESAPLQRGRAPEKFGFAPAYGFHGRARELLSLQRKLRKHGAVVVSGMGGMGKTSLAREAAQWWHRTWLRPGGAAFFSFETRQGADRAVAAFVRYLEGEGFEPGSPDELWDRAVRLFREREVLWVWDNFESTLPQYQKGEEAGLGFAEEERDRLAALFVDLMDGSGGKPKGWLVVTCRPDETGLTGIAEMGLTSLAKGDALAMARVVLERKDVQIGGMGYEREAVEELIGVLEGHPLSIELVMPHLEKSKPGEVVKTLRALRGLLAGMTQEAGEGRNKSLVASLRFSTERLSEEAREMLPWLAWFEGGAFEDVILDFCGVDPEVWRRVRGELLGTALVKVDDWVLFEEKPYLHFHPTLSYAAGPEAVEDEEEAGKRFVEAYYALAALVDEAFRGASPSDGMAWMDREEGNLTSAMALAFERGDSELGVGLAETLGTYLQSAGRVRDRARVAAWVQEQMARRAKKEAKLAARQRLAQGDGQPRLPSEMRDVFLSICQALHAALVANHPIPPDLADVLADMRSRPDPLGASGRFLQAIAAGGSSPVPANLPPELAEIFTALLAQLPPSSSSPSPASEPPAPPPLAADDLCPCNSGLPFSACHGAPDA